MKIVIVNYRFFVSGGPERYLFNIMEILEKNGHTVIPFSIKHNKNAPTEFQKYFLEPVGSGDEIYANEYKKNSLSTVATVLGRMLYSFDAKAKFTRLLNDVKPDLVYILHYQNKISASIIDAAFDLRIPIVQRISDFGHICINNTFYLPNENKVCEKCLQGSKWNGITHKCADGSLVNSVIKVAALKIEDFRHTLAKISAFCIPARFTLSKFIEFNVPEAKLHHLPTFFNGQISEEVTYGNFFLYVGRIVPDKGLLTLMKAFVGTKYKLIVIGSASDGYDDVLKDFIHGQPHDITFLGKQDFPVIKAYLKDCLATICPSEWYENIPNTILESFAFSKAVLASDIGSLKELVEPGITGLRFTMGDHDALRRCLDECAANVDSIRKMGENAKQKLLTEYGEDVHYDKLMSVFHSVLSKAPINSSPKPIRNL